MSDRKDIAVILVGMNTRAFVVGCLETIAKSNWGEYTHEIIYVDNGSKDDSLEILRRDFPYVKVVANQKNVGFTAAANQAARIANSRYHLQINNDTLVDPDSIRLLAEFLDSHPKAAIVGGRIFNPDGSDQWSARRFPKGINAFFGRRSPMTKWFPNSRTVREYLYRDQIQDGQPFRCDWVPTVYCLIREESFWKAGGLPEDLYYWAEGVFCLHVHRNGGEVWVVPRSTIVHFEGHGGGPRPYAVRKWHIKNFHRGAYRLYCEYYKDSNSLAPARWLTAGLLYARAVTLLAANKLSSLGGRAS